MNKPTKQTIAGLMDVRDRLTDILRDAETRRYVLHEEMVTAVGRALQGVSLALTDLTRDEALPCGAPGCHVIKPTKRALSAHRAACLFTRRDRDRFQDTNR